MTDSYTLYNFEDEFFAYTKPDILQTAQLDHTVRIGNKEIDTNGHLNNQKSAELLMDALPYDFEISEMTIL